MKKLAESWKHMQNRALFLDRDGIINKDIGHLYEVDKCEFIEGIFELCKLFKDKKYLLFVITNQAGIAKKYYSESEMHVLHNYMDEIFIQNGLKIEHFYYCPHHPEYTGACNCRKPEIGMLMKAVDDFDINLKESVLIGDKWSDIEAGMNAGVKDTYLIKSKYITSEQEKIAFDSVKDLVNFLENKEDI